MLDTANEEYNKLGNNKVGVNKTLVDKLNLANSVMNKLEDSVHLIQID